MGSTINVKKLAPDKDLAIISGLLKGLNTRKKEMEEAQAKKQETAMKWYEAYQKAMYNQSMAKSKQKDVESSDIRRKAMTSQGLRELEIKTMEAEDKIRNTGIIEQRFQIEFNKYVNRFDDAEKIAKIEEGAKWTTKQKELFVISLLEEGKTAAKNKFEREFEAEKQTGRIDIAKVTGGTDIDIAKYKAEQDWSQLEYKTKYDAIKSEQEFRDKVAIEEMQQAGGKYKRADTKRSDLTPQAEAYEKDLDAYNKAILALPTPTSVKNTKQFAETVKPIINNLYAMYSNLYRRFEKLTPEERAKVTDIGDAQAIMMSGDDKKVISGLEAERGMFGGKTTREFMNERSGVSGTITPSTTTGLTPTQITWIETQKKKKLTNQQIIDATPSNLKEEVKKRLENE
jgi:hypothetical protein